MAVYIYSMPKAGTYFLAKLLESLGFEDTGFHIDRLEYLDTRSQPPEVNTATPAKARVRRFFVPVVRELTERQVAFGHFALPLNPAVLGDDGRYVCAYRDPRATLVSEFLDFRFRRTGVAWALPAAVPDDKDAFVAYLKRHGVTGHLAIFREFVLLRAMLASPLASPHLVRACHFVNFDHLRGDAQAVVPLARFLHVALDLAQAERHLAQTLAAETKTKATGLSIDRNALWTDEAEAIYARSRFPQIRRMAENLGLAF